MKSLKSKNKQRNPNLPRLFKKVNVMKGTKKAVELY